MSAPNPNTEQEYLQSSLIRFNEDWYLENNRYVIADYNTTNESFLEYATILKRMDIKNHLFHLQLHSSELVGVDPLSDNLTLEQKTLILQECGINPFYILREVLRIKAPATPLPVPFKANRANMAITWAMMNNLMTYVVLQRQVGKTVTLSSIILILINFMLMNSDVNLITKDSTLRAATIEEIKSLFANLPEYLRLPTKKENSGSERITVNALENNLNAHLAQKSKVAANNVGRGLTSNWNIFDEFGFLYNLEETLTAAISSGTTARELAEESGMPYGTAFFTTASYLHTDTGKYAKMIYDGSCRFTEDMFDLKNNAELKEVIAKNSTGLGDVLLIEFSHRQLNKTDGWLRRIIRENLANPIKAAVEFMNIWSNSSTTSALKPKQVKYLNENIKSIDHTSTFNGFMVRWYVPKERLQTLKHRSLLIGIDSSDMLGSDTTALVITDPRSGETIGTGKYNNSLIPDLAQGVYELMEYLEKSVLIIESRSSAVAILDQIAIFFHDKNINIFKRVFNWVIDESQDVRKEKLYTYDYLDHKKHFGYKTAGGLGKNSRVALYDSALSDVVDTSGDVLNDKDLISDMCALEEKNGRIDHTSKKNDDIVIARLLTDWFMRNARNVEYYGIEKSTIMSTAKKNIDGVSTQEIEQENMLIDKINKLVELIPLTKDATLILRIETTVYRLETMLKLTTRKSLNIQARMEEYLKGNKAHKPKRKKRKKWWD